MSKQNLLFTLFALRVASRATTSQPHYTNASTYRTQAREFVTQEGEPTFGDMPDDVLFGPIELLWKQGCLELKKYFPEKNEWWDYEEVGDLHKFLGNTGFGMKLTAQGQQVLSDISAALADATPPKHDAIGFHA